MSDQVIAAFRAKTAYRGKGYRPGATISVCAKLHKLDGNSRPCFSLTGEIREPRMRDISASGCIHEEVLRCWPKLAPIVALHLSDDTGETYGNDNGCRGILADHLRISAAAVDSLAMECAAAAAADNSDGAQDWSKAKAHFASYVLQQAERWQSEANDALALIRSLAGQE